MNIVGHATPTKQLHWLLSIFVGILMCKIVYELTGVISSSLFKGYNKLSNKEKLKWNNRGFSTFHAIVVAVGSMYLLLVSDLFLDPQDVLIINRSSTLSNTLLGVSIGYFLSDLTMIFHHYPALGGIEYVIHHGLSMYSIILSLLSGQAQIWYLDAAGLKNSKMYIYNGVTLFFGWLVSRIILFVFFFCHMYIHFDQCQGSLPNGLLQLGYSTSGDIADELVLVLENCQRYGKNLEKG
ncbi:hypothetical protein OROMI_011254 [Orobanche minor]